VKFGKNKYTLELAKIQQNCIWAYYAFIKVLPDKAKLEKRLCNYYNG
jgi:hypothetical protein